MKRYLVMAHYEGDHALFYDLVRERMAHGSAEFFVVVPATPPRGRSLTWSEEQAYAVAKQRLAVALNSMRSLGANVSGKIGAASITDAIDDTLREQSFDEVILATPPATLMERLFGDLGSRVKQIKDVLVTQVVIPQARPA